MFKMRPAELSPYQPDKQSRHTRWRHPRRPHAGFSMSGRKTEKHNEQCSLIVFRREIRSCRVEISSGVFCIFFPFKVNTPLVVGNSVIRDTKFSVPYVETVLNSERPVKGQVSGFWLSQINHEYEFSVEIFFAVVWISTTVSRPALQCAQVNSEVRSEDGRYSTGQMKRFIHLIHSIQGASGRDCRSLGGVALCARQ